ncbi:DUF192 domain-containing protein [Granulicella arctica]|uniref:DUF192 domain-containing protein n=1 Tax=Granulicella arctica TaxID=940613 RepID=UPI0037BF16FA
MNHLNKSKGFVRNHSTGRSVCESTELATSFLCRLQGLLGRRDLARNAGLWLCPSSGIHTFGMKFSIDVVSLNKEMEIVGLAQHVPPWRIAGGGRRVHSILELPGGSIELTLLRIGQRLVITACPSS